MSAAEIPALSGADGLVHALKLCVDRAAAGDLSLGDVLDEVQEASYAFICIVLCLPFLQPFSLGPLAVAGGLTFALLGWQCLAGHHAPVLPRRVRAAVLQQHIWELLLRTCIRILGWCAHITAPRFEGWVTGLRGHRVLGAILLGAGLLMALPFFGLPFNNALPALAIFFVCLGQLERDGLMIFVSLGFIALTLIYFTVVLGLVLVLGHEAIARML